MAEGKKATANEKTTRLVRLDMDLKATVQLEVPADSSPEKARELALGTVNSAIRRAEEDEAIKLVRQPNEQYYDRKGK
jgi:hypothetical protein